MSTLLDALNSAPAPSDANPTTAGKQAPTSLLDALNSAPAPELNPSDLREDIEATAKRYGLKFTSGLRSPERNAAVKGAKRSHHLRADEQGRPMAMDWAGSPKAMREFYADLKKRRGPEFAEMIFGTPDHQDHVHLALRGKTIPKQAQKPIAAKGAQRTLDALSAAPAKPGLPVPGVIPDLLDTPFAAAMRGEKMPGAVKRKAPGQERFARVAEAGAVQLPKGAPPAPKQKKGDVDPVNLYVVKPPTKLQQVGEVAAFVGKGLPGVGGMIQGHEDINRALAEAQQAGTAPASVPMAPAKSPLGKEQAASLERLRPLMEAYNARLSTELDAAKMSAPSAGAGGGYAPVGGAPDLRDVYVRLGQQWNWQDFGAFLKSQGVQQLTPWEQKLLNTAITAKKIEWGLKTGRDLRVSAEVAAAIIGEAVGAGLAPHIIRTLNITPAKNGLIRAFQPNEANVGNTIANTLQEGGLAATEEGATPLSVAQAAAQGAVTGYGATAALGGLGVAAKAVRGAKTRGKLTREAQRLEGELAASNPLTQPRAQAGTTAAQVAEAQGKLAALEGGASKPPLPQAPTARAPRVEPEPLPVEPGARALPKPNAFQSGDVVTVLKPDGTPRPKPGTVARRNADGSYVLSGEKAAVPADRVAFRPQDSAPATRAEPAAPTVQEYETELLGTREKFNYDASIARPRTDKPNLFNLKAGEHPALEVDPSSGYSQRFTDIIPKDQKTQDGVIWRGMSHAEFEGIRKNGVIKSDGSANLSIHPDQTVFSVDASSAMSYGTGFAQEQHRPTFGKPGYLVKVKEPSAQVSARRGLEVDIDGPVDAGNIVEVVEARLAYSGSMGSHYAYRKLTPEEAGIVTKPKADMPTQSADAPNVPKNSENIGISEAPTVESKAPAAPADAKPKTGFSGEKVVSARDSLKASKEKIDGPITNSVDGLAAYADRDPEAFDTVMKGQADQAARNKTDQLQQSIAEKEAVLQTAKAARAKVKKELDELESIDTLTEAQQDRRDILRDKMGFLDADVADATKRVADSKPTAPKVAVQPDGSVVVDGYGTVKPDDARKLAEVVRLTNAGAKAEAQALGATLPKELRTAGATITRAGALDDLLAAHPEAPKVPTRTAADIPLTPGDTKATSTGKLKVAKSGGKLVGGVESSDLLDLHRAANSENAAEELEALRGEWGDERFEAARKLRVELGGSGRLDTAIKELEGFAAAEEAAQLADVDKLKAQEAKKTLAQAVGRVSALSRGVVNAGENTARKGSPAVTFRDIGGSSVADREALLAAVLAKNAKREGYRYQTRGGVLQNGANLRETIVEHGMLPSDVGVTLKQDAPTAPKVDADGRKLPSKAALAKVKKAAAKLDLQATVKSEFDALKEMISNGQLIQGSMGVPDPEIVAQAVKSGLKIARAAGRYGIATAEEFGLLLRERVGDVSDRYVKEVWDLYRAEKAGEQAAKQDATAKPPADPPSTPSAKPASLPEPKTPEGQSVQNRATRVLREAYGLKDFDPVKPETMPDWAREALDEGLTEHALRLAREVNDGKKRAFTAVENFGLSMRLDALDEEGKALARKLKGKEGAASANDVARYNEIVSEMDEITAATKTAGTQQSRDFSSRRAFAKDKYGYTGVYMGVRADLGRKLTPAEESRVREATSKWEDAQAIIAEEQAARANSDAALKQAGQDISDLRTQLGLQALKLDELSRGGTPATGGTRTRTAPNADRVATLRQTQADALARAKQKLAAASKELGGGVPRAKGPGMRSGAVINPVAVAKAAQRLAPIKDDILTYAKALVEEKAIQASELPGAVAKAFSEFGMPMSADEVRAVFAGAVKSLKPGEVEARVQSDWEQVKAEALKPFKEAEAQQKTESKIVTDAQKKAARLKAADALTRNREWKAEQDAKAKADRQGYAEWWKEQVAAQDNADKLAAKNAKIERLAAEKAQKARDAELAKEIADAAKAWEKGEREIAAAKTRAAKRLARGKPEAQKLLDRMQRIGEQRALLQSGKKPVAGKNVKAPLSRTDPELRKLQLEAGRQENELAKLREEFKRQGEWEKLSPGQRTGAIVADWLFGVPRTFLASGDVQGPFRQGGSALFSDPKRWKDSVAAMAKGATQKGYDEIAAEIRIDPRFNDATIAKLELPAVEGAGTPGEDYLPSRKLEKVPGLGAYIKLNQRTYDANLTALRFGMFKDWVDLAERGGKQLSAEDLRYIGNAINTLTGRGVPKTPPASFFFALRYRLSNIDAATLGPVRRSIARSRQTGDWTVTKVITQKYVQSFGLQGALLAAGAAALANSPLKEQAKIETDYRSANFGQVVIKRGNETLTIGITSPQLQMAARIARLGGTAFLGQKMKDGSGKEQKGSYAAASSLGNWIFNGATPSLSTLKTLSDAYGRPDKKAWGESYDLATDEGKWNLAWGGAPITGQSIREILQSKNFSNEEKLALFVAFFTDVNRRTQSSD